MFTIFYLSTCDTCRRILKLWTPSQDVILREIKAEPIDATELDRLMGKVGNYKDLLNTRSRKLKEWAIDWRSLSDAETRELILRDYSLLKRPILETPDRVLAGNSKKVVEEARTLLHP
ncbi:MAG: hypothetical protein LPK80_11390 [Bacteroidota bacterium]|nr:hypothetical protein [Bacteroidota bacterium]MDX5427060.1 hypothetical protein [Bacteroidota bacterium]MDX5505037.1 hypothetical protein [Bacteroidota bacterium]